MKLTGGKDVPPRQDVEGEKGGVEALNRVNARRSNFNFSKVGIMPGSEIVFTKNSDRTAKVIDQRSIELDGEKMSLTAATLNLLQEEGYEWLSANGVQHWEYEGEILSERRNRLENEEN